MRSADQPSTGAPSASPTKVPINAPTHASSVDPASGSIAGGDS
jgi:hypothetical protein